MSSECPCCKATGSWEAEDGQLVCTECGAILEDTYLTADSGQANGGGYSDEFRAYARSLPQEYARRNDRGSVKQSQREPYIDPRIMKKTTYLLTHFRCPPEISNQAYALVKSTVIKEEFKYRREDSKYLVVASCVFIVCRNNGWEICERDIGNALACSTLHFISVKKEVLSALKMTIPEISIEERVPRLCSKLDEPENCTQIAIETCARGIIQLCRKLWINYSVSKDCLLNCSVYLAWKAERPAKRSKVALIKWANQYKIKVSRTTINAKLAAIVKILCKLAQELPWLCGSEIDAKNVHFHIKDILLHQKTLLADMIEQSVNAPEDGSNHEHSDQPSLSSAESEQKNSNSASLTSEALTGSLLSSHAPRSHFETDVEVYKFVNPILCKTINRKRRKVEREHIEETVIRHTHDIDSSELCDEDLTEEEARKYLKTDEECQNIRDAMTAHYDNIS